MYTTCNNKPSGTTTTTTEETYTIIRDNENHIIEMSHETVRLTVDRDYPIFDSDSDLGG